MSGKRPRALSWRSHAPPPLRLQRDVDARRRPGRCERRAGRRHGDPRLDERRDATRVLDARRLARRRGRDAQRRHVPRRDRRCCDGSSNPVCSASVPIESAVAKASPDDAIYGWWLLTLEPPDDCDPGVDSLLLGIGEMNAEVEAAIPSLGYDAEAASDLNGAYFGAAGVHAVGVRDREARGGRRRRRRRPGRTADPRRHLARRAALPVPDYDLR